MRCFVPLPTGAVAHAELVGFFIPCGAFVLSLCCRYIVFMMDSIKQPLLFPVAVKKWQAS